MKSRGRKSRLEKGKAGELPVKVTEEGAEFRSYRDGRKIKLTPESSVAAQKSYGSDIIIPLDELPPYHIDREKLIDSVYLSHRWMARSLKAHLSDVRQQAMYAVVHGGVDEDIRQLSIDYLSQLPFDGYCIGGSLGKDKDELIKLLEYVMPRIPQDKPNHLLGQFERPFNQSPHEASLLSPNTPAPSIVNSSCLRINLWCLRHCRS